MDEPTPPPPPSRSLVIFVKSVFWLTLAAAVVALVTGPGNRLGWWSFGTAFGLLGGAAIAGGVMAVLAVIGVIWSVRSRRSARVAMSLIALLVGLLTIGLPMQLLQRGRTVPMIHDISTDTKDPPKFVALAPLRATVPNGADYGGPEVAALQRAGYPDITPFTLAAPPDRALNDCLRVAKALGWDIMATSPQDLRIEATDTTPFFGFKDDIIIRITPAGPASRIDLRSVLRVGRSDLGANARRIRDFYKLLSRLQPG